MLRQYIGKFGSCAWMILLVNTIAASSSSLKNCRQFLNLNGECWHACTSNDLKNVPADLLDKLDMDLSNADRLDILEEVSAYQDSAMYLSKYSDPKEWRTTVVSDLSKVKKVTLILRKKLENPDFYLGITHVRLQCIRKANMDVIFKYLPKIKSLEIPDCNRSCQMRYASCKICCFHADTYKENYTKIFSLEKVIPKLEELKINLPLYPGEWFLVLNNLSDSLKILDLSNSNFDEICSLSLKNLRNVESLDLSGCHIHLLEDWRSLYLLARFSDPLKKLNLSGSNYAGQYLDGFLKIENLQVNIRRCTLLSSNDRLRAKMHWDFSNQFNRFKA